MKTSHAELGALPLRYAADAACPEQATFQKLVSEKLAAGVSAETLSLAQVTLELRASAGGFTGQLALQRADGTSYARKVSGVSCDEVSNALAFVLALALGEKAPVVASTSAEAVRAEAVAKAPGLKREPALSRAPLARVEQPLLRPSDWRWGAGVELGVRSGLAPRWALLEGAYVELEQRRPRAVSLTLRGAFLNAPAVEQLTPIGSAQFSWWAGRLEACPARLRLAQSLSLLPCAGMHVGRLYAAGKPSLTTGTTRRASRLWADVLFALRVELAAARWLSLQAQGEGLVPVTRYDFGFDSPSTPVYPVPAVAAAGFVGFSARFP